MNHVFLDLRQRGLLEQSSTHCIGREKAFVLSDQGKQYARPLLDGLNRVELQTLETFGKENIRSMVKDVLA